VPIIICISLGSLLLFANLKYGERRFWRKRNIRGKNRAIFHILFNTVLYRLYLIFLAHVDLLKRVQRVMHNNIVWHNSMFRTGLISLTRCNAPISATKHRITIPRQGHTYLKARGLDQ
jgi:hypothetical protein